MNNAPTANPPYLYRAYGLNIESEIAFPEMEIGQGQADVMIQLASGLPRELPEPARCGWRFQARPSQVLLTTTQTYTLISDGKRIQTELKAEANIRDVRLLLLSWGMGALFHQRGILPLHGCAMEVDGGCVVFCAASGVGKSTLTMNLLRLGYHFLDDNVAAVQKENGQPIVHPGLKQLKLLPDTMKNFGLSPEKHEMIHSNESKYTVILSENHANRALSLRRIYLLKRSRSNRLQMRELKGQEKAEALQKQIFHARYIQGLGIAREHYSQMLWLAGKTQVIEAILPDPRPQPEEIALQLLEDNARRNKF